MLAVDTTEARRWRRRESNPLLLGASEALFHLSYIPKVRTGGVEPPQREAAGLQPVELTDAQRPQGVTGRARTGAAGLTTPDASLYTTATTSGDDRTRTGGLSADNRALFALSYAPQGFIARAGFEPAISSS